MEKNSWKLGTFSLLIALAPVVILTFVILFLFVADALNAGPSFAGLFGIVILPFILLLVLAIDCAALMMGIAGIFQKNGNKMAAFIGIILSVAPIALFTTLFINS